MKTLFLFCFLSFNSMIFARQIQWNEGVVVLKGAEVHQGEISVDLHFDLVLFRQHDSVMVYPAHRIQSLYYYDAAENINRKFISLSSHNTVFRLHRLYEIVLRGDISVLRKQKGELLSSSDESDRVDYEYLIKMEDELVPLMHFRTKVYPELLKTSREAILDFVESKNVNPNKAADAIQIIKFYNSCIKDELLAVNY